MTLEMGHGDDTAIPVLCPLSRHAILRDDVNRMRVHLFLLLYLGHLLL